MDNKKLTSLEEKFCMIYVCGPSPYNGNAHKTFELVFRNQISPIRLTGITPGQEELDTSNVITDVENSLSAHELMRREDIKERIKEIKEETLVNASTLAPRLTATLMKIIDECSTVQVEDRWGTVTSPAALRSVAVNAISKLMEMYGIKEDIAHKLVLEGADGDGITFNLIVPESNKENDVSQIIG